MPTLDAPNTATIVTTIPDQYVSVDCSSGSTIKVSWIGPGSSNGSRILKNIADQVGPFPKNTNVTVSGISGSGTYSDPTAAGISIAQSTALGAMVSGAATTIGLDGSFRLASLTRGANTISVTRPNSTTVLLTLPNAAPLPASVVTITLDGAGRNTGFTSNFF